MKRLSQIVWTIRYLKPKQILFRLFYLIRKKYRTHISKRMFPRTLASRSFPVSMISSIPAYSSCRDEKHFTFLNIDHSFCDRIDWNISGHGKLWTYNLTYFDFLQQREMTKGIGLRLISDFINQASTHKDAFEPFPISLRGINWIKFVAHYDIHNQTIDDSLYAQYHILCDNLEYHLLGNHLLENGFSLLFGAYYFRDDRFYALAKSILIPELDEQILDDGAHFELSPMYHQIMLYRVLDCINLVKHNSWQDHEPLSLLESKASMMLGWLETMTYRNGTIPLLNDSANGIAPTTRELLDYAARLEVDIRRSPLSSSGYRKITHPRYECVVDVGQIGPDYIPGHAHADTLNFELSIDEKPFIVDSGLSTYQIGAKRDFERSTAAHNAVEVNQTSSSHVWGGFRVAQRANVTELVETPQTITASHDGYRRYGIKHTRRWQFEPQSIMIEDHLALPADAIARIHFHPDISEEEIRKHIIVHDASCTIGHYDYAPEFNKTFDALVMEIPFAQHLTVEIAL